MPRTKFPGIKHTKLYGDKVERTEVSFRDLCEHGLMQKLITPPHQGAMRDTKISEMVEEYNTTPQYWAHKQTITISIFNGSYFLSDGQHRIEAAKILYREHSKTDGVNWHTVDSEEEMRNLFNSINKDSTKNELFVSQDVIVQARAESFVKYFNGYYKGLFPRRINQQNKRFPIEVLRDKLLSEHFFDRERHTDLSIYSDFYESESPHQYILRSNAEFYKLYDYRRFDNDDQLDNLFYRDEISTIKDKLIFMLRQNNFLEWLKDKKNVKPFHHHKIIKKRIPAAVKGKVWTNQYGDAAEATCPITLCENAIRKNDHHCGHITSEKNGGKTSIDNLRPICSTCNSRMGSQNWGEYEKSLKEFQ